MRVRVVRVRVRVRVRVKAAEKAARDAEKAARSTARTDCVRLHVAHVSASVPRSSAAVRTGKACQ